MSAADVVWPISLTRFPTLWPGQFGVPGTDQDRGERLHCTGEVFYVDPNYTGGASDLRDGTSPTEPLATVGAALTKCTPYHGDTIAVMANAAWQYANPSVGYITPIRESVIVDVPGVRIVGIFPSSPLGVPWYPATTGGTCITIRANDVLVEGFCFDDPGTGGGTGVAAIWGGGLYGDNPIVRHCYFGTGLDYGIRLTFSYYATVHHCRFEGIGVSAINDETASDSDYPIIHDNLFLNCLNAIKLVGVSYGEIYANRIVGNTAGVDNFIDLTGGGDNMVSDNWLGCTLAGAQYTTTCTGGATDAWVNNHCIDGDAVAVP